MRRILWVNGCSFVGGSETAQLAMFRELRDSYEIVAAIPERPGRDLVSELTSLGITYHETPFFRLERTLSPPALLRAAKVFGQVTRRLSKLIKTERVDIVHTANLFDLPFCAVAAKLNHSRLLWLIENPERFDRFNTAFVNMCSTDAVIGTSNQILSDGLTAGLRSKRTAVIGNPYDDSLFYPAPSGGSQVKRPFIVGFAGVLCERKGALELCRVYAEISRRFKRAGLGPCELHLAGSGAPEYTNRITAFLGEAGVLGETKLLGNISRQNMRAFYQNLDLYVMLSKREGLSVAMLEAMASGAPSAIMSPWGDDVIVDGNTGVRLTTVQPEGVADAVWPLVADPSRRTRLGRAGADYVKANFSPKAVAGRLRSVYDELFQPPHSQVR